MRASSTDALRQQPALRGGGLRRLLAAQAGRGAGAGAGAGATGSAGASLQGEEVCVQLVLRPAAPAAGGERLLRSSYQGQDTRLDAGSCDRVQQLLAADLTQAAAHLGIHVTQPFAPAACQLEQDLAAAAVEQQQRRADGGSHGDGEQPQHQHASAAADEGDVVLARWRVCGWPVAGEDSGLVAWALELQLQEAAESYYAAALGPDFDTCPPRLSGLVAALEVVKAPGTTSECATVAHQQPLTAPCSANASGTRASASAGPGLGLGGDSSASTAESA